MPNTEFPLPDWNRAFGFPIFDGVIKQSCSDFKVDEIVSFKFSDDGEHDWLRIRKTDANTGWVARVFAKYAGVPVRDVGYSGLKDRRAIATQWFSVRRPTAKGTPWERLEIQGIEILEEVFHEEGCLVLLAPLGPRVPSPFPMTGVGFQINRYVRVMLAAPSQVEANEVVSAGMEEHVHPAGLEILDIR